MNDPPKMVHRSILFLLVFSFVAGGFCFLLVVYGLFAFLSKNIYEAEDIRNLENKILNEKMHLSKIKELEAEIEHLKYYEVKYKEYIERCNKRYNQLDEDNNLFIDC